jgi:hypothetical protein
MVKLIAQDTYIYSEVFGPSIEEEFTPEESTSYPDDTYGELVKAETKSFPWGWVSFGTIFIGLIVGIFFWLKGKLLRKDSNAKVTDNVTFEIKISRQNEIEIGVAEQMFANLASIEGKGKGIAKFFSVENSISFEIIGLPGEIRFFVNCPRKVADLVEKQILGSYQEADVTMVPDYNIFKEDNRVDFAALRLDEDTYFPITTYEDFTGDPLSNILSPLSKMAEGEGALVQVIVAPADSGWQKNGSSFVKNAEDSMSDPDKKGGVPQDKLEDVKKKISKTGFRTEIRIVTSAANDSLAKMHLDNIIGAFDQFNNPQTNKFKKVKLNKAQEKDFVKDVLFRRTPYKSNMILNVEELASIFHMPNKDVDTPNIQWLLSREAPVANMVSMDIDSKDTIWIGNNHFRGNRRPVCFKKDDRRRHTYILGQTGSGKSWLMMRMIIQDIYNGDGVCFIDPHGETAELLLERIPPERAEDVIYFNAGDFDRPFGFNLMEYYNEQDMHRIVNSFIALLIKLFDPNQQGFVGPIMQQAVRNSMLTAMSKEGSTLIEVVRILQDETWVRDYWLPLIKDEQVRRYWTEQIAKTDQKTKSETMGYFLSKFDKFTTNLAIRNIIGQSKSSFDFRKVMDNKKILIVNLSKGILGDENMSFLGLLLVQKLLSSALSREDVPQEQRPDFFFYADEFQNFTTDEFATILSEARKYRLNLTLAHQYIGQLPENIKGAVFGNVGTLLIGRTSAEDGEFLAPQFDPVLKNTDIINQANLHFYAKMLVDGMYPSPFSLETGYGPNYPESKFDLPANKEVSQFIKQFSRTKYGRDVNLVNKEISERARVEKASPRPNTPPTGMMGSTFGNTL